MEIFSKRLKTLRKERKLSQQELANLLGVSKSVISQYEKGISNPTPTNLFRLANIFNVSIDYFYGKSFKSNTNEYIVNTRLPVVEKIPAILGDNSKIEILFFKEIDKNNICPPFKYFFFKQNKLLNLIQIQSKIKIGDNILACINKNDAKIFTCSFIDDMPTLVDDKNNLFNKSNSTIDIIGTAIDSFNFTEDS